MILGGKRVQTQGAIKNCKKVPKFRLYSIKLAGDISTRLSVSGVVRDNAVSPGIEPG